MPVVTKHKVGTFSYTDLTTSDAEGAKAFYTKLFAWDVSPPMPTGDGGAYMSLMKDGKQAAGLMQMNPAMRDVNVPPYWNAYVTVESADAAAAKVTEIGGTVLMGPFDVMGAGRMAAIRDSTGAVFSLWEPQAAIGAEVVGEPGALCWTDLYTRDIEAATVFYHSLFGWDRTTMTASDGDPYHMFELDGEQVAGMMEIRPEWGEVPPYWSVYLGVEDIGGALRQVKEMGGTVEMEPIPVPGVGTFALVRDPQGGYFMPFEMDAAMRR